MFSRLSRLPLRRCLHTGAPVSNSTNSFSRTAKIIVGVSVLSTACLTWRLRESRHIALDSPSSHNSSSPSTSKSSLSSMDSNSPSGLSGSSNSPPNAEVLDLNTDLDTGAISGDAKNGDKIDEEGSSSDDSPGSGGAFNPETGEINWDCPCLGGMAHGPCGPEFREAFSCFVYSEAEPKGINCVEKFQNMQNCFRAHPEIYADEIMDDDEEQIPHSEPSNTDKVGDDATPELNTPSKPPIEGEVSS